MEQFPNHVSAKKYLYTILSEKEERFMTKRFKNWEFFHTMYLEQKKKNVPQEGADTMNLRQLLISIK